MRRVMMVGLLAATLMSAPAHAAVQWVNWTGPTVTGSSGGSTSGSTGSVGVTYSGELQSLVANYPTWNPSSTFNGAGNAPPQSGGIIQLFGGGTVQNTITFSTAVVNPVIAIWSLGQGGINASFNFSATPTILSGGPSAEYAGQPLTQTGNNIFGVEGNGVVRFNGSFTSISWTNPVFENWYGFTVGASAVPEPGTWAMMLIGFGALGWTLRRRKSASTGALAA